MSRKGTRTASSALKESGVILCELEAVRLVIGVSASLGSVDTSQVISSGLEVGSSTSITPIQYGFCSVVPLSSKASARNVTLLSGPVSFCMLPIAMRIPRRAFSCASSLLIARAAFAVSTDTSKLILNSSKRTKLIMLKAITKAKPWSFVRHMGLG